MAYDKNILILSGVVCAMQPPDATNQGTPTRRIKIRCSGGNRADEITVKLWGKVNDPTCPVMVSQTLQIGDTVMMVGKFSPGKEREHNGRIFHEGEPMIYDLYKSGVMGGGSHAPPPQQQYAPPPSYQQAPPPQQAYQHPPQQAYQQAPPPQQQYQQPLPQHQQYPPTYGQADYT